MENRFIGTPKIGFSTWEYGQNYRLGNTGSRSTKGRLNLKLGVDEHRRKSSLFSTGAGGGSTDQRVLGRTTMQW